MTTAETYVPPDRLGWWGGQDTRTRCTACGKVVFPDEAAAERSADKARCSELTRAPRRDGKVMQAYIGQCGHWHVGHGRKKRLPISSPGA